MDERLRFVARLLDGEAMTDVCREFGISRKTGYKIFDRYKEHGLEALSDRSRRPVRYANQLPQQVESLIVRAQAREAALGRAQDPRAAGPAAGRRRPHPGQEHHPCGARSPRPGQARSAGRATARTARRCPTGAAPNDLWCADFKGEFKLGNGQYCYPLTVTDHASRFLLLCEALRVDPRGPGHHRLRAAVPRARPAAAPSAPTTACPSPAPMPCSISPSSRSGGCASASPSSASSPAIRSRTAATSACTSPSRRRQPGRQA